MNKQQQLWLKASHLKLEQRMWHVQYERCAHCNRSIMPSSFRDAVLCWDGRWKLALIYGGAFNTVQQAFLDAGAGQVWAQYVLVHPECRNFNFLRILQSRRRNAPQSK
jgi:hypothetical protein